MRRIISYLSIFGVILIVLSACGDTDSNSSEASGNSNDGDTKISVILKGFDDEHWRIAEQGAKDAGEDLGVDVKVLAPSTETEIEKQIELIDDQLTGNTDGLVLAPAQPDTVVAPLQKYSEKNVPVLLIDSDADYDDKLSLIGTENFEAGKLGGEYMGENLDEGDKVAIIRGPLGSTTHDKRTEGAEEEMETAGLDVVSVQSADADKTKALNVMEDILQSNPDIKGVFTTSGAMAVGAYKAVENSNADVFLVGFDSDSEALTSIRDGGIAALVAQKPYDMGYKSVEKMLETINGEEIDSRIDTGADIVTQENAQEFLDEIEEYSK